MVDLSVNIGGVKFSNPLILASGTCGFGRELEEYIDFRCIGALSSKGLTIRSRLGNEGCRVAETPSGMLNSVGLQNPGVPYFIEHDLQFMASLPSGVVVNVAGHSTEDYIDAVRLLQPHHRLIDAIELNLSCPNVKEGCMVIGASPDALYQLVSLVRKETSLPLWIKLTPNVTDITQTALAAQKAGADAVVASNTLMGMAIDVKTRRPILHNNTGGLSGPCIKPIALRMVQSCASVLDIPVIGCGGISSGEDVLAFLIAGASAVQIGTSTLIHPAACETITEEIISIADELNISGLSEIIGTLNLWR